MLPGLDLVELPADAVEVGKIMGAWGVKGGLKVLPYSADPQALFSSKRWYIESIAPAAARQIRMLRVQTAKEHGDTVLVMAHDITDRDLAEFLKGFRIWVSRSSFPTLAADEFYWVDLIGLSVLNREGQSLGVVRELMATGPQTVLVLDDLSADRPVTRMIPFVSAFVDRVDLQQKMVVVDWQPDY